MPHLSAVSNRIRRRPVSSFHGGQQIGGSGGTILSSETPAGAVDGVNAVFELSFEPASLLLFLNGVLQTLGGDYTLSGTTITFATAPFTGDIISAVLG